MYPEGVGPFLSKLSLCGGAEMVKLKTFLPLSLSLYRLSTMSQNTFLPLSGTSDNMYVPLHSYTCSYRNLPVLSPSSQQ